MGNIKYSGIDLLKRNTRFLMLAWTVIIAISLGWTLYFQKHAFETTLHTEAAAIHGMDMEYRNWVIHSGGVYVPVGGNVVPSPWMSDVPERDIKTPSGKQLTLLNSSYVVRLVHEGMDGGGDMRGHIASLRPINPINAADEWERQALEAFGRGSKERFSFTALPDGKTYFRYMKPMVTEEACLKCHARYGDKLGDIRGGVSIAIPVDGLLQAEREERNALVGGHGLIWGLGLFGLFFGGKLQRRATEEIEQGQAQVLLLANSIAHSIYGQDVDGNCTFVNAAGVRSLGYANASELLGKNMHMLVHHTRKDGSHYPYAECPTYSSIRDGKSYHVDDEILWRKDGSSFPVAYWSYPVVKDGKTLGAVVTFLDITEQLRVRDELKSSRMLLNTIIENIPAMVFLKRADDLRFELFNRAGEQLLGYARADLLGKNDYDLFTKDQADFFIQEDRAVLASRKLQEIAEEPIKTADGSEKWLHTFKTGLYDEAGNPTHLLGISVDITARKRMADELRASAAKLAEAQRMAHLGHWLLDLEKNELQWSDEIFRIFEIDPQQFGATYEAFLAAIHPDDRELVNQTYRDSLKNRSSYQVEHRLLMKDGRIKYVHEKGETTFAEDGMPLRSLGTVQDVTATKFSERALREQRQVLEQALEGTIHTVSLAVELRDPYTAGHQRRVAELSCAIASAMGLSDERIKGIRLGATIHDIGKIGIPAEVLSKPSRLSPIEVQIVREHAAMGFDILKDVKFPWPVAQIAHQHHERIDGSGYPLGLKGEEISLEARIVAVADVVESMATHRPYRPALGMQAAKDEIANYRGMLYDAQVVDACRRVLDEGFQFT
ncbi:MAG TPA: HD domain-containing phosphohydrolase [Sideroxyarcus sp.]|nr:HD domain-containing phosphohydrolase [Sideroxyarcus sp.]